MTQRDDSVMVALRELGDLEAERIASERRAAEETEAARARAEAEAAEEEARGRRAAEAEARARVEREMQSRDAEAEQRIALLRAELEAVRADRERIHATVARLNDDDAPIDGGRSARGWIAFGGALVAAAAILVAILTRPPVVHERIVQVPVATPQAPEVAAEAPETPASAPPATAVDAIEPTARPAVDRPQRPARPQRPNPSVSSGMHGEESVDPELDFDHCGDDPTCGLDL